MRSENQNTTTSRHKTWSRRRGIRCLGVGGFVVLLLAGGFYLYTEASAPPAPPRFEQVRQSYRRSEAVLLDRHGEVIHEIRVDHKARRLDWIPLHEISPALKAALLRAEDRRFYEHHGVDWHAFGSALFGTLSSKNLRGASTLTMQLAAQLQGDLQPRKARRSLGQKWRQIQAAREMERRWTKPQILEAYLNLVTFRGELQGIASAARALMNKQPHGLDDRESVLLAALVRSPNAPQEQVTARACQLAEALNLNTDCRAIAAKAQEALAVPYVVQREAALAPHVALMLLQPYRNRSKDEILKRVSTLDGRLQRFAMETLQHHLLSVRGQNVHDGAVMVVENKTGEVLAYVGNMGDLASARFVDGIQARRQAGSILKPFLYGLAIQERLMTAASLIDDRPIDLSAINGIYRPENYDHRFHGLVTTRVALASSLNIPAVKTLTLVGVEKFVKELQEFGFRDMQSADYYGPSLALGSADVALWDLVNAYRTLANGGLWSPLRLAMEDRSTAPPQRALSAEAAFIIADILSDRESRSQTFDLESPLSTRFWTAVKTGTSKDMRDNWCVGFSSEYTVGVWAGNFSGDPMWNVSGITGAAPVWVEIMNWLHRDQPSFTPKPPPEVVLQSGMLANADPSHREWFLRGTETTAVHPVSTAANFRILYPASGTLVALDPDIPEDEQKLFFEAKPADASLRFVLDGEEVGSAGTLLLWSPTSGKHTLALVDTSHQVLDRVTFEVRGNLSTAASERSPSSSHSSWPKPKI